MIRVVGIGAGGHAKVILDILLLSGDYVVEGLLDAERDLWGSVVGGVPVLGGDERLHDLYLQGVRHVFNGVGDVGGNYHRREVFERVSKLGFDLVSAIHPRAVIAQTARLGRGVEVMAGAIINPDACLGDNAIVNTGAIVEHDCIIGDHAHVAVGASLAGGVRVGSEAFIGLGASVKNGVRIGSTAVVGAGAVVLDDVPDDVTVVGIPARIRPAKLNVGEMDGDL